MTVGGVMSVDGGAEDQVPYTFRASGGGLEIGNREIDTLVGGTVAWNQLIPNEARNYANAVADTRTYLSLSVRLKFTPYTVTFTRNLTITGDYTWIFTSSFTGKAQVIHNGAVSNFPFYNGKDLNLISDHRYVLHMNFTGVNPTEVGGVSLRDFMLIDLTAMFGTTIADYIYTLETATPGAGVAWFRRLFPNDYYAYNAGELKSVEGVSAHMMRGFNQWDEEWELGEIYSTNGKNTPSTTIWRSKDYIPVIGGGTYFLYSPTANNKPIRARYYDANKNYIGYQTKSGTYNTGNVITLLDNVRYMRFAPNISDIPNHDICINLSDPDRNGTYEPYESHTYALDDSLTLRGIPKLDSANRLYYDGDRYSSDGTVTRRYGIVDLGTLTWVYYPTYQLFTAPVTGMPTVFSEKSQSICDAPYQPVTYWVNTEAWANADKVINFCGSDSNIRIKDTSYETALAFKSSLSGKYLVFKLATPTTETADPYINPQIVDNLGTEEYITTGIVPVGHYTQYPTDIVAKVDGLPSDFSTLIAPTETGFKASRAYSVNQFLIVNNQLYRVTVSIASGATITPGTNVTAVTVADILTQLLNA